MIKKAISLEEAKVGDWVVFEGYAMRITLIDRGVTCFNRGNFLLISEMEN